MIFASYFVPQLVFKVKANYFLDKVSPWNNDNNQTTQLESEEEFFPVAELKKCFENITVGFWFLILKPESCFTNSI